MFKYSVYGSFKRRKRPCVIAVTSYKDVAEYVAQNAAAAMDPDGRLGLEVHIVENPDADFFIRRTDESEEA